jgi:peptidoglycan/LPS O-acetylase OafA/YrhL
LGNISFSIYLLHDPLLLECGVPAIALLRRLLPEFPVLALLIWSSLLVTVLLGLSTATYHLVEQPGRRLGNLLARRLRRT